MKFLRRTILFILLFDFFVSAQAFAAQKRNFNLGFSDLKPLAHGTTFEVFKDFKSRTPNEIEIFEPYTAEGKKEIFVSPNGKPTNNGTMEKPFGTLREAIRAAESLKDKQGGVVIYLRAGEYSFEDSVLITQKISGTNEYPTFISAYNNESVTFHSGTRGSFTAKKASETSIGVRKLQKDKIDKIRVIDLKNNDLTYELTKDADAPKVTINNYEYHVARWPNNGYTQFAKYDSPSGVVEPGDASRDVYKVDNPIRPFEFAMTTFRPTKWENTGEIWFYGRMRTEYNWERYRVASFNPEIPSCRADRFAPEGCRYSGYNTYYFYNVMEELDYPGEYFYDKKNKLLFFYPFDDISNGDNVNFAMPSSIDCILDFDGAHNVVINGINFEDADTAIKFIGTQNVIQNCTFRNITTNAINANCIESGIICSQFFDCGRGILLHQNTYLEYRRENSTYRGNPSRNFIQNNYFERLEQGIYSYEQTQTVFSHNSFNALRKNAVMTHESNVANIIEYNESLGVVCEIYDGGDYYYSGMWSSRLNTNRYNYMRGYASDESAWHAVYFDDTASRNFCYGNIAVDKNYYTHGGSYDTFYNNVIIGEKRPTLLSVENSNNYTTYGSGAAVSFYLQRVTLENQNGESAYVKLNNDFYRRLDYKFNDMFERLRQIRLDRIKAGDGYERTELEIYDRAPKETHVSNNIIYNCQLPEPFSSEIDYVYKDNYLVKNKNVFTDFDNYDFTVSEGSSFYGKIDPEDMPPMEKRRIIIGKGSENDKMKFGKTKLLLPLNDNSEHVEIENLALSWEKLDGATTYRVIVAKDKDFNDIVKDEIFCGYVSSCILEKLEYDTTYYWKVEAECWSSAFDGKKSVSDVSSFTTYTAAENAKYSELETYSLQALINQYAALVETFSEDNGTDIGVGVYKPGTKELLNKRIDASREKIKKINLESQLNAEIASLKEDFIKILTDNAIPYTRKLKMFRAEEWSNSDERVKIKFAADYLSMKLISPDTSGSSMLCNNTMLSPKEGVSFKLKYESDYSGWSAISARIIDKNVSSPLGADGYFFCIKSDVIEIQKIKDGKKGDERIVYSTENNGKIPANEWVDMYVVAENTDDGVHILLKANGQVAAEYTDTENPVLDLGYFGIKQGNNHPNVSVLPSAE